MVQGHKTQGAQRGVYNRQEGEGVYNRAGCLAPQACAGEQGWHRAAGGATGAHSTAGCGTTNFCTAAGAPGRRKLN